MEFTHFDGLALLAAPHHVMTPRPASTELVAVASAHLGRRTIAGADVGTGSGALAIAIAKRCPNVEVWATDISRSACVLAAANVRRHRLEDRVFVRYGDLLAPVPGQFGLVVANLPYLAADTAAAHPELADQPFTAVFAPGDGLDPYRRLLSTVRNRLADGGLLVLQLHGRVVVATPSELPVAMIPDEWLFDPMPPPALRCDDGLMRSSDSKLLDTAKRSAAEVLEDHLQLREAAELEEDLRRNYATDVVLLSARGVVRGHEGVKASAAFLYEAAAGHEYSYHVTVADDRMAMLEWSAAGHDTRIVDGVDSYLIEDGLIKAQTIHYRVRSRELSVSWDAAAPSLETARGQ